jgi:RNA polymerase-binding transcription factor DksA
MIAKGDNYDPFFRIKSSKKKNPEGRTTLDTLHNVQIQRMYENESDLLNLIKEKDDLQEKIKNVTNDIEYDQIENNLKIINNEIEIRKNKNEFLDYFLDTGDILYKYYDIQERIQDGTLPAKQYNKKKVGSIFDVLEKAAQNEILETKLDETVKDTEKFVSRDKLLEEYLIKIHPENAKGNNNIKDDTYGECSVCDKEMVFSPNEAVFTCMDCGYQEFILIDSDKPSYKDPPREVSYYAYKRINHFNEWLAQFQAKESTDIPSEVFDVILVELKKERILDTNNIKQTKIREILKKLKLNKYYEHVPHIINRLNGQNAPVMNREVEEKLRYMFKEIQPSFQKHCPEGRNNFLSYSYVLYKFCELLELDEYLPCFPLLKNRDKLYVQDKIWQQICADLSWEYIRSI